MSEGQKKISEKIALLRREGKTESQAAGEAYGMQREGRLGRHGAYHRAKRKGHRKGKRR
jgi:hypothetical protein